MAKKRQQDLKGETTAQKSSSLKESKQSKFSALWDKVSEYSNHRYTIMVAFILLLAVVFIRYAEPLMDNDLWWHMEYGEYMVKNLTLQPDHSIYSWTVADPNWIYNGWIPQIFFYLVYSIGGVTLLHVSHYLFLISIVTLFLYYNRRLNEPLNPFYLLAILSVLVCLHLNASQLRPEIFSVVFITLTVFIYFYSLSSGKNLFWLYPALMLIWVNSHGIFIFGMIFLSVAFAGELLNYFFKKHALSKEMLKYFFISVVLSYAVLIITPYGPKWVLSIITYFTDPQFMRQAKELVAYKSVFQFYHPAKYILSVMSIVFGILSIYMLFFKRYFNISIWLINALFIYLSFMYARSAFLYLPVWYFSMVYLISILHTTSRTASSGKAHTSRLAPIFLVAFIIFSIWTINWAVYNPMKYKYFGFGVGEYMPEKVADFLLEHKLEGPLFNTYEIGGYLLWRLHPHYRIFIDPRHGPYTKHLADDYRQFELGNNFEVFTARYPFKIAVVKLEWIYLVGNFLKSPDWKLIYFDTSAALFANKTVNLPDLLNVDLGPERFKDVRSYEALIHVMFVYLGTGDFKSAWYVMDLVKAKYNYGRFKERIAMTEDKIREFEKQKIKR